MHNRISRLAPIALGLIVTVLAALPLIDSWRVTGPSFALPAIGYTDANNYLAQLGDIAEGHWFFGNPYYLEHIADPSPTVFVSDWIASIPLHLGASLPTALAVNLFLWSWMAAAVLFWFFRQQKMPTVWSSVGALAAFLTSYLFVLRPVSLQVIFPFFILFLAALFAWYQKPTWRNGAWLAAAGATGMYLYSYLGQLLLATMGITFLIALIRRRWGEAKQLIGIGALTVILLIPFALYAAKQVTHPAYWDMLTRTGLVLTRVPPLQFFALSLGVLATAALWIIPRWRQWPIRNGYTHALWSTVTMGGGMILAAGSHIITGKELEIAQHIQKFTDPWIMLSLVLWIWAVTPAHATIKKQHAFAAMLVALIILALLSPLRALNEPLAAFSPNAFHARTELFQETQATQSVLAWLNQLPEPVVIWVKDNTVLNDAIVSFTPHRVLFSSRSTMQLTTTEELENRYLVSQGLNNISQEQIETDFRAYAGPSAIHPHKTHNRTVYICQLLQLPRLGIHCGEQQSAVSFKGRSYFAALHQRYAQDIVPHMADQLFNYQVSYIVNDAQSPLPIEKLQALISLNTVYDDGRFQVMELNAE